MTFFTLPFLFLRAKIFIKFVLVTLFMDNNTKIYHYKKELAEVWYNGGIICPVCSDIQNPKGQTKFNFIKIDDYKIKCNNKDCETIIIFDG